ncbi:MAG: type II toxin-antitoxin system RelE/ParE family toxin [Pseudomonadota bacterium]
MPAIHYAKAALNDLSAIYDYTAENWGVDQAEDYQHALRAAIHRLADGNAIGRKVVERSGYSKYTVNAHCIFFRRIKNGIEIIRVLHQAMDTERHL